MVNTNICFDIFTAYPIRNYIPFIAANVGIGALVLGFVYVLNAVITVIWIKQQQRRALQGMEGAAKNVIFPVYLPFMWSSAFADFLVGTVILFVNISIVKSNSMASSGAAASLFAVQHFVIEGVAFALMQYGCGFQAAQNATIWSLGWGATTFICQFIIFRKKDTNISFYTSCAWNSALLLFYFVLWQAPKRSLFRRDAVVYYARFWVIYRSLFFAAEVMVHHKDENPWLELFGNCIYTFGLMLLFVLFKPFIVYQSLLLDSTWWQGVANKENHRSLPSGARRGGNNNNNDSKGSWMFRKIFSSAYDDDTYDSLSASALAGDSGGGGGGSSHRRDLFQQSEDYEAIRKPLLGVEVGFDEAQQLAQEVDRIRSEGTVKLLNFAYISLDKPVSNNNSNSIVNYGNNSNGSGTDTGTTKSLLGAGSFSKVYSGQYRGVPVAIKMLFTQDLNPEVIKRCHNEARILSEISPHPNVVNIYGVAVLPPSVCLVLEICEFGSLSDVLRGMYGGGITRHPLILTTADRMYLALGCARGVQALHEYSSELVHRDIKSFNFLIDSQLNAKIADLELGVIKKKNMSKKSGGRGSGPGAVSAAKPGPGTTTNRASDFDIERQVSQEQQKEEFGMNITWQAPEVLLGQAYTQKSDVYSLSLVLWEIIASRTTKFYGSSGMDGKFDSRNIDDVNSNQYAFAKGGMASPSRTSSRSSSRSLSSSAFGVHSPGATFLLEKVGGGGGGGGAGGNGASYINGGPSNSIPFNECSSQFGVKEKVVLGYRPSIPSAMTFDLSPKFTEILVRGWQADPSSRPTAASIAHKLQHCWEYCMHKMIYETEHIVDYEKIEEENVKMSILNEFKSGGSGIGGYHIGSALSSRPMPGLGGTWGSSRPNESSAMLFAGSTSTLGSSVRAPPSANVLSTVSQMQLEPNWSKLELEDCGVHGGGPGAYLVVSPEAPFYIIWTTKKWTHLTGYLLNDVLACDTTVLQGPRTNFPLLQEALGAVVVGNTQHIVTAVYRRDGRAILCSIHMFPVFDSSRNDFPDSGFPRKPASMSTTITSSEQGGKDTPPSPQSTRSSHQSYISSQTCSENSTANAHDALLQAVSGGSSGGGGGSFSSSAHIHTGNSILQHSGSVTCTPRRHSEAEILSKAMEGGGNGDSAAAAATTAGTNDLRNHHNNSHGHSHRRLSNPPAYSTVGAGSPSTSHACNFSNSFNRRLSEEALMARNNALAIEAFRRARLLNTPLEEQADMEEKLASAHLYRPARLSFSARADEEYGGARRGEEAQYEALLASNPQLAAASAVAGGGSGAAGTVDEAAAGAMLALCSGAGAGSGSRGTTGRHSESNSSKALATGSTTPTLRSPSPVKSAPGHNAGWGGGIIDSIGQAFRGTPSSADHAMKQQQQAQQQAQQHLLEGGRKEGAPRRALNVPFKKVAYIAVLFSPITDSAPPLGK